MRKLTLSLLLLLSALFAEADNVSTFKALVARLMPDHAANIVGKQLPAKDQDYFTLSTEDGKVVVGGNDANSMAVGLNYYLKYYCNTTVSWYADDAFAMPDKLPEVKTPVEIKARVKNRFFLNYCTFGYTMPWWNWKEWEHFIDWMALNGINLPLAITGQESIWYKVWTKLGLKGDVVRHYFTGPSHLPWHRMINLDYWWGDLPMSWLNDQETLQKRIVARERELNMRPVLPAFSGHVPQELKQVYPNAKITKIGAWSGFTDEYAPSFLDPMDPIFKKVQKMFLKIQNQTYGTDHIYGIDLFNEIAPPSYEASYLKRVGNQVYGTLHDADPKAVWLQMTWLFWNEHKDWTNERIKAFITSYPADKSLLLDYYGERKEIWQQTEKYYGVPYIWCYLGNFGGNTMLAGNISEVNKRIENTVVNGGKNFSGIGSTLEGFDCNPFMYEYIFEKAWDFDAHKSIATWAHHIADEHVGHADAYAREAWDTLLNKVYVSADSPGQSTAINIRPALGKFRTYYSNWRIPYRNRTLLHATELMLKAESDRPTYSFDVVNLTRQLLGNYFKDVFNDYQKALKDSDFAQMKVKEFVMMGIISDVDRLISTQRAFLVGKWIDDARAKGINADEKLYFERNARNLITTWGQKASTLNDYANRTWGGLTDTFYGERWRMFFDAVDRAFMKGEKFDEQHQRAYEADVTEYEDRWWRNCIGTFSPKPVGDGVQIARELIEKYKGQIK
jgi:alpha-N-acetylglucosaminidase